MGDIKESPKRGTIVSKMRSKKKDHEANEQGGPKKTDEDTKIWHEETNHWKQQHKK